MGVRLMADDYVVLVVDDEAEVRAMLVEYLESRGYRMRAADNLRSMVAELESHAIDIVLLDRTMPDGDGLHVIPIIRDRFNVPIILLTALGADGDRIIGLETGADDYVCKPFNPRELAARIQTVIRRARSGTPVRQAGGGKERPSIAMRRMAAVLFADVEGYVRLMHENEAETVDALWSHRRNVIEPALAAHRGRLVKYTGDGFLAEFSSAADAVACALRIQDGITRGNEAIPAEKRMRFRMGLNWCSVVADHEDIHGDGVNIAARLQTLAPPGGVCASQSLREALTPEENVLFDDIGERYVKNIREPIRAYQLRRGG
jgi:class 3 adenylate cyclase